MPDYRVPDRRERDMRMRQAGLAAFGLRDAAGAWSIGAGTDGWFPDWLINSWPGGRAAARKLVAAGVWTRHQRGAENGYQEAPAEWNDEQTPAWKLADGREQARLRSAKKRQRERDEAAQRFAETHPHLPGSLVGLAGGRHEDELAGHEYEEPPTDPSVTRDVTRDAPRDALGDVTQDRHGERSRPPQPRPLPEGGHLEEEGPRSVPTEPSVERAFDELGSSELAALDPRCDRHQALLPGVPVPSCNDCGTRRHAIREAQQRARDRDTARSDDLEAVRATRRRAIDACNGCDEYGWELGDDGQPADYARHCTHDRAERELHSADPPLDDLDERVAVHRPRWDEQRWATS